MTIWLWEHGVSILVTTVLSDYLSLLELSHDTRTRTQFPSNQIQQNAKIRFSYQNRLEIQNVIKYEKAPS